MKANDPKIKGVFNQTRILEIPFFQRSYVWDEENWERFLDDMKDISSNKDEYFFGSLIIKRQNLGAPATETETLIDGQQRITTLIIFFKFLCLKLDNKELLEYFDQDFKLREEKKIALIHNHNDREYFEHIVNLESYQESLNDYKDSNSQIIRFYEYLVKNIDVKDYDYGVIMNKIKFITIGLDSHEDEQKIFDTTNSLGVTLTTAELLKNYLFNSDQIDFYNSHWKGVFEKDNDTKNFWDQEITTGRFKRNNIDLFLYSYMQIKLQDLDISSKEKAKMSRVNKLFNGYQKLLNVAQITKEELVKEIKEYANIYSKYIRNDVVSSELTHEFGIERINVLIFHLGNSVLIPYVLFILKSSAPEEHNKIFCYLESYVVRRIICKETNKNYNNLFSEDLIRNEITTLDKLKERINNKVETTEAMPTDKEVINHFIAETKISHRNAVAIIYMLETKIRNSNKHSEPLFPISKYSLEHLMPKNWRKNWALKNPEETENRNKVLLTLGNLAIITLSLNASIKDGDWKTKKNGTDKNKGLLYYANGFDTLHGALDKDIWDEEAIAERANFLATKSLEVWKK